MRLRVYRAASVAEAMARARAELGPDALVLGTRRAAGGIELTAAVEPRAAEDRAGRNVLHHNGGECGEPSSAAAALRWHGVPDVLAKQLAAAPLPFSVSLSFRFAAFDAIASVAPLLIAGPPGAGKTLTVARLATRFVLSGKPPLVVAADHRRAGAVEQLEAYTRLLGIELAARPPDDLAGIVADARQAGPVLIDMPGLDAFDHADSELLAATTGAVTGTCALVLPAGLDVAEAADLASAFRAAGATLLVATRLDMARRIGGTLAAAAAGLALAEAGVGPGAADGLRPMTPEFLAARLMTVPETVR